MVDALRHRGPDGDGVRRIGPVSLAHTRLAIIDVAGGDQPLVSEDGQVTLIANGEIYNHRALRASLEERGHRFATGSDCEAILHAYEEHGARLRAPPQRHLRLRPLGRRPRTPGRRPRPVRRQAALLVQRRHPHRRRLRDRRAAPRRPGDRRSSTARRSTTTSPAASCPPRARSSRGVSKLPAASLLIAEEHGAPRIESWRDAPGEPHRDVSDEELADRLAEHFTDAVERQMMSDVPYGAFLSGGVDSAAVVAAMAKRSAAAAQHLHDRLPRPRRACSTSARPPPRAPA